MVTGDTSLPFRVLVERRGPLSKGRKFYSGAASESDAIALAATQNNRESSKPNGAEYVYTVERS